MPLHIISKAKLLKFLHPFYFHSWPPILLGVIYLAFTRDFLFKNDVKDFNSPEALSAGGPCTPTEVRFRTYDGRCNSLNASLSGMGMKNHRFGRSAIKDPSKPDPGLFHPDPFLIAEKLLRSPTGKREVADDYSLFMTSWINLNIHDWFFHDFSEHEFYTAKWGPGKKDTFKLRKTIFDEDGFAMNTETPWWDASQIYGTSEEKAKSLRVGGDKCEMRLDDKDNLPLGPDGLPEGGLIKNWWAGVEILHNLFVKEHNFLCDELRKEQPEFTEEELYQTARLIVAAMIARIHTVEWTPALLSNDVLNVSMHNNWNGVTQAFLDYEIQKVKRNDGEIEIPPFITKAVLHIVEELKQYTKGVGHATDLDGVPYSLSEDFVSSYRMHPLLPDDYIIDGEKLVAKQMINSHAREIIERFGKSKMFDAFGHSAPTTLTLHNYPNFLTKVDIPGEDGPRNMAFVDVTRDRERSLPRYNECRRQYGLDPAKTFHDITDNHEWAKELSEVYESVEDVDFLVGTLAESPRPKGYIISETAFYVFIMNASRRLLCDRFFQEAFHADSYTQFGLDHIARTGFKELVLRHYPELETSIGDVKGGNAFYAWQGPPLYSADHSEL